ncbi:hypothetical protein MNBD_BACTEROID01-1948 [hydrothermal vent metagenome]|uniref:Secretion system C-terminal sorting domain-containing protein n=1 Tax=hydrothermal vent metagenome TaxID=652676 RepID=A0A3B0UEC0_9ZZZZ
MTAHSQFLNKEAVWVTGVKCAPDISCKWYYYYSSINKDTMIENTNYSVIDTWGGLFALREENSRIYYKALKSHTLEVDNVERLMYDFDLNVNDTFNLYYRYQDTIDWVVKRIDSILVGNVYKKMLFLDEINSQINSREAYWIEDIGSSYGPFWIFTISQPTFIAELYCYSINNEKLFGKCKTVGLNSIKAMKKKVIFYDPRLRRIKISLLFTDKCNLNIYSLSGIKVLSTKLSCNKYLDVDNLKDGLYIFEVINETGVRYCEKIIIY